MIILAFIAFLAFITIFSLGLYVDFQNSRAAINRVFFYYCIAAALSAFAGFNSITAESIGHLTVWMYVQLAIWPFLLACQLHFVLVFAERVKVLRWGVLLAVIYVPAIVLSGLNLFHDDFRWIPVREAWGGTWLPPTSSPLYDIASAWMVAIAVLPFLLCLQYACSETDPRKKRHAAFVCVGLFMHIAWSLITQTSAPLTGVRIPASASAGILFASLCYGYAVFRHGLFVLTPISAAEEIVSTMSDALFLVGSDRKIQVVNQSVTDMLGYDPEELLGREFAGVLFGPDNDDCIKMLQQQLLAADYLSDREVDFLSRDGRLIPVSLSASTLKDDDGTLRGVVYVGRNISERKQAEAQIREANEALLESNQRLQDEICERTQAEWALRESEAQYRAIFNAAGDGLLIFDSGGRIVEANPQACKMYGYAYEELIGSSEVDLLHPENRDKVFTPFDHVRNHGKLNLELANVRKEGTPIIVQVRADTFSYKGSLHSLAVVRDVTEQRQVEKKLEERETQYRRIFDSVRDGLVICDWDGTIIDANPQACFMHGRSHPEMIGLTISHLVQADWQYRVTEMLKAIEASGTAESQQTHTRREGSSFDAEVSAAHFEYQGKRRILLVVRDITEKKRLEAQLLQAQKMEAIGSLAGGIAHDFNNILTAIIGYGELLKEDLAADQSIRENLDQVLRAGLRAKDLVRQILTFSQQAGNDLVPLEIHMIVKEAIKLLRSFLPSTITIQSAVVPCGTVLGNATQIHQVIMNLCTNAYQAMGEEGGVLEVALERTTVESDHGHTFRGIGMSVKEKLVPGPYVCLTVRDTGHGMSPEIMKRIFDPYFSTKRKEQGTGLGLFVVQGIVSNHRGMISVESVPGRGSAFSVLLPQVVADSRGMTAVREEAVPSGTERILLVDDEPAIVEMGKKMLERLGYRVTACTRSTEALRLLRERTDQYDLMITDMTMPLITGEKLAVEALKIRHGLPVILFTGFSENINAEKARKLGIRAFLLKPLVRQELATVVRSVLDEEGGGPAAATAAG